MKNKWPFLKDFLPLNKRKKLFLRDEESLPQLLKTCLFSFCFLVISMGSYSVVVTWVVPYYKQQEATTQQQQTIKELRHLPTLYPEQWKLFQAQQKCLSFKMIKIKTVFHKLLQQYNLMLKEGHIHPFKGEAPYSFHQGKLIVTAKTDQQIFNFLTHIAEKLAGILKLKMIKIHRIHDVNEKLLAQLKAGKPVAFVEAAIEFEWLIFKDK